MNFLLSMLGNDVLNGESLRRVPREQALATAATLAAEGRFAPAAAALATFIPARGKGLHLAVRGHLLLLAGDFLGAERSFAAALKRWNRPAILPGEPSMDALADFPDAAEFRGTTLERLVGLADKNLRTGRFTRAVTLLQRALAHVEAQLGAQAGLIVSAARRTHRQSPKLAEPLIALARLGDALLRALARAHLADNFADSLRKRNLRADLAVWAVGSAAVEELLTQQYNQLLVQARSHPANIELHLRTGLLARALGDLDAAKEAFTRVLRLHPHHLGAAARMAATSLELEHLDTVLPVLAVAFALPADLIARYRGLAHAAVDPAHFDRTVDVLVQTLGEKADPPALRANLAMALAELGLLTPQHATWRDPLHTPVPAH